jgi:HTH-type transcriptional regulator, sugar sensing transcriptional regulator
MYTEKLQELGLTRGEAKVYEALLMLGPSTVGPVVKRSGVAYSNIYEILNRLMDKGLVSFIVKERTKYFQAEDIKRIKDYLVVQEKELESKKKTFNELQPKLEKLGLGKKKEEAEVFIGEKGLMTAYEKLVKGVSKDKGYFFYVHNEEYYERAEKFYVKSWHLMKKNKWKGLSCVDFKKTKLIKRYPSFIEQRFVLFPVPGNIDFIGDKVLITTWKDKPIGILIHSKEIVESYKEYFKSVWELGKK